MSSQGVMIFTTAQGDALAQVEQLLAAGVVVVFSPSVDALRASSALVAAVIGTESSPAIEEQVRTDRLEVDLARHEARWDGRLLPLTAQELQLLATLVAIRSRVLSVAELGMRVWGYESSDGWEVRSAVKRLRRKLAEARVTGSIEAVRGVGFRWTSAEPLEASGAAPPPPALAKLPGAEQAAGEGAAQG